MTAHLQLQVSEAHRDSLLATQFPTQLVYLRGPAINWGGLGNHVRTSRTMMAVLYRDLQCPKHCEPRTAEACIAAPSLTYCTRHEQKAMNLQKLAKPCGDDLLSYRIACTDSSVRVGLDGQVLASLETHQESPQRNDHWARRSALVFVCIDHAR